MINFEFLQKNQNEKNIKLYFKLLFLLLSISLIGQQSSQFEFSDSLFFQGQKKDFIANFYPKGGKQIFPKYESEFDSVLVFILQHPEIQLEIGVHSEQKASTEFQMGFTGAIANQLQNYFTQHGITPQRVKCIGYGGSAPITVSQKFHEKFPLFKVGEILNKNYADQLLQTNEHFKFNLLNEQSRRISLQILKVQ